MRALLVESDPIMGRGLHQALTDARMSVDWVQDGEEADLAAGANPYALILLDLELPKKRGFEILQDLRKRGDKAALLMLSDLADPATLVNALDLGADDYLVKPFAMDELLARIRAVMRRQSGHAVSTIGNQRVTLDLASAEMSYNGKSIQLPAREFALMRALLQRPGAILSRDQLEERVYGWGQEVESNAVEVLIHYVRKKFDKYIIRNVRGAGWMVER